MAATNSFGTATATTTGTVTAAGGPAIGYFGATPATITPGQQIVLNWSVASSATTVSISPGVGVVTGKTYVELEPSATTTYTLTAANSSGARTATTTVTVKATSPPVISSFRGIPQSFGRGVEPQLYWSTAQAATLSIDQGVGTVTGSSNKTTVRPTRTTTYMLTAANPLGSVTAQTTITYIPLQEVNPQLYYTEHAVFVIPPGNQVNWSGSDTYDSVYSTANVNSYVATLKKLFPADYDFVVVAANNLTPNNVPHVLPVRRTADGIGLGSTGVGVPSLCYYNIGGGTVIDGAFGVLDHEIGHNWGIFLQPYMSDANGHWFSNSTAMGQMAATYSDDRGNTTKSITGDPANGFTWTSLDNIVSNETETFSDQDLYLQGFAATFPDIYVLTSPVYKPDKTVSYSSFVKYDQDFMRNTYGVRNPSYRASRKRIRMAFIYVARDLNEVQTVYQPIESSANNFVNGEQIDTTTCRVQVPFLVETRYRASANALLADLDGNATPTLSITGPTSLISSNGSATVPFKAADPGGLMPEVSCVPTSSNCSVTGGNVILTGLASGAHFFTIKAQDSSGKKTFAHFVIDVQ